MKTNPTPWKNAFLHEVIRHTDEPMVATLASIEFGQAEGIVNCGLHPQWVLGQQNEKAEYALWAVQNCHDNDALAQIAETSNRSTILRAIAESPYAWAETRERAAQRVRAAYKGAGTLVPPQLAEAPSFITYDAHNPFLHIPSDLDRRQVAPYVVTELIEGAMAVNAVGAVKSLLYSYYIGGPGESLWSTHNVNLVALVARLTRDQRIRVLAGLLDSLRNSRKKRAHLLDADMLNLIMTHCEAPVMSGFRTTYGGHYAPTFDAKAFDTLLSNPSWQHLLEVHQPTPKQLKKILAGVGECREHWLVILRESRILLRTALDYRGPGSLSDRERTALLFSCGQNVTRLTSGKEDDFFSQIVGLLDAKYVATYVVNGLGTGIKDGSARVFPDNSEISDLVARVGDEVIWEDAFASSFTSLVGGDAERARILCDNVPGAWRVLITSSGIGDTIREGLLSSGLDLREIINRLYSKERPLYTFPEAKAALGL